MAQENSADRIDDIFTKLGLRKNQELEAYPTLDAPFFVGSDNLHIAQAPEPEMSINGQTRLADLGGALGGVMLSKRSRFMEEREVVIPKSGTTFTMPKDSFQPTSFVIDSGLGQIRGRVEQPVWMRTPQGINRTLDLVGAREYKVSRANLTPYREYVRKAQLEGSDWAAAQRAGFTEATSNPIGQAIEDIRGLNLNTLKAKAVENLDSLKTKIGGFFRRGSEKFKRDASEMVLAVKTLDPARPAYQPTAYTLRARA